jgi:Zn-dependent protease with chaperone function
MKKIARFGLFGIFLLVTIIFSLVSISLLNNWITVLGDWIFYALSIFYLLSIEELYRWAKSGKRSELSDFVALLFFFFLILFISKDVLTSIMGAFSIYLWFGIVELKDYPVLNKILIISLATYNVIFVSGIISSIIGNPIVINTAFSFSFWIILGLGFILFGRRYIVIWRFMSPEYLTLFLYIIAWLAIVFINQYTPLNFISNKSLLFNNFSPWELILNVYVILIMINWLIYFISGPILDFLLGIKPVEDKKILNLIEEIKMDIGIKTKVKVGIGKYPILNAMAYGSFLDKRIALIVEDFNNIPIDELKGIVAHELAHTKGKHTLILTLITTGDLIFRMILGIPATYYDYTFGNPQLPFVLFILLNLLIYVILFMFVRILEGKADAKAKNTGYANELVKALYNLESFYATGREIGLNTMLLCDEKINTDNEMLNFLNTADYINKSIIKPKRISLISNLINSHPPTYHRIVAILDNKLKPTKEMLLPFICLKKSKQRYYANLFEHARKKFNEIASDKFREHFEIQNIATLMHDLNRRELYKFEIEKDFIFTNKITNERLLGKLENVQFKDDICDTDELVVKNLKNNNTHLLISSNYTKSEISLKDNYYLEKEGFLKLLKVDIIPDKKYIDFHFVDKGGHEILKPLKKIKLPNPISLLESFIGKDIFFRKKGETVIIKCSDVKISEIFKESELFFDEMPHNGDLIKLSYALKDLIIKPKIISITIKKSDIYRESEQRILNWLVKNQIRTYFYLKKPVNNLEVGVLKDFKVFPQNAKNSQDKQKTYLFSYVSVKNIFGKDIKIPYKSLEGLSFENDTAYIQKKTETSLFSKLGYIFLKKFKPEKIFYLNKV